MRGKSVLALCLILTGCGPRHLTLADGKCVKAVIGDTIEGVATLHSYAGLGCIECGAFLTQKDCPTRIDFRADGDEADQAYDRITKRRNGDDPDGPIERRVSVSGTVIPNGATGAPLLNADRLTSAQ